MERHGAGRRDGRVGGHRGRDRGLTIGGGAAGRGQRRGRVRLVDELCRVERGGASRVVARCGGVVRHDRVPRGAGAQRARRECRLSAAERNRGLAHAIDDERDRAGWHAGAQRAGGRHDGGEKRASVQVEAIQVHHLRPGRDEVGDELLLRVRAAVDFGDRAQL